MTSRQTPQSTAAQNPLFELLKPKRLTAVVDIGANPVDGAPPYAPMLAAGLCTVVGFEPQEDALAALNLTKSSQETYLPYIVGDGKPQTLHICAASGMTSLLKPDPRMLSLFHLFPDFGRVEATFELETRPLDAIVEIEHLDFLKIDVQGGEMAVFRSGQQKLSEAVVVQTEVSFVPLYEGQPSFGEVDLELRAQGFIPHAFTDIKRWMLAPLLMNDNPRQGLNQLLEADMVYVRDFSRPEQINDEQLKHLALISHHCYHSYDLTLRCLLLLEQRGAVEGSVQERYLQSFQSKA
jgi:FkbM family methyltransferase